MGRKNVILLELDFPRRKNIPENIRQQNANLQQAFQVMGYPTVWVFDLDKNDKDNNYSVSALGKTGYSPSVTEFTQGGTNVGQSQTVITIIKNYKSRVFSSCFLCLF